MVRDTVTEQHEDCLVKRLTAPQEYFIMQFSVAADQIVMGPTRQLTVSSPNRAKLAAKHAFVPRCLSETEEVIYVLFGYGSLVWRIGCGVK